LKEKPAAVQLRWNQEWDFGRPRNPNLKRVQREGGCSFRQDADDEVRCAIERQCLTEHRRIAIEALLPHLVADQDDMLAAGRIFIGRETATDRRLQAQCRQQCRGGLEADELLRIAAAGQRECVAD
jgi:hypothetical protein